MIPIRNDCTAPPRGLEWHVRRCLDWHDPRNLDGIGFVWLLDELPPLTGRAPKILKSARERGLGVYGLYHPRDGDTPAHVMLFVRDIYRGISSYYWWSTIPTLSVARTLAHEVGHHLYARRGFIFQPGEAPADEEELATRFSASVLHRMLGTWPYRLGLWHLKNIAMDYYVRGMRSWEKERYREAAEHWYTAWTLNPELGEAAYWYHRAKKLADRGGGPRG